MLYCVNCSKELIGSQRRFCSIKCNNKIWRIENKGYSKEYYKKNTDKMLRFAKEDKTKHKEHYKIRSKTHYKYGKLPNGWQYHHYTEPYDVDNWIGVYCKEHRMIEKRCLMW